MNNISDCLGKMTLVSKVACIPAVSVLGLMCWALVQPNMSWLVILSCVLLGIASLGIYPIMLELSVECTYPLDESVVTGLCYLSSAFQVHKVHISSSTNFKILSISYLYVL